MQAPFIFGLPTSHFDLALLWQPEETLQRRVPRDEVEREQYKELEFPAGHGLAGLAAPYTILIWWPHV